MMISNLK